MRTCRDALESERRVECGCRRRAFALLLAAACIAGTSIAARADDDLPGRVGRIAEFAGQLFISPEDRAAEWQPAGLNYPVASGDNLWVGGDGRAEVDYGGGQFRLAGDTNLHVSRLDENQVALFIAQGRVIVRVRVLDAGDAARVDTPNTQVELSRPGLYRIDVTPDRQSTQVTVREGEALIALANGVQQALPGQTAMVTGTNPRGADIRNGIGQDGFDAWSATRDRRYERPRATAYVSRQMVGYADLDEYGTWQSTPEYGAVWYPTSVPAGWAPYSDGYWTNVGGWGSTWVDAAPWGYAPFHYGRWAWVGGRWGWCPGTFVARPVWAPALVGWVGGAGLGLSATFGSPIYGWVPLGWGEPFHPWWNRCSHNCWANYNRPYAVNVVVRPNNPPTVFRNVTYPGAVTAVTAATLAGRQPVASNRVNVPLHQVTTAPVLASAPTVPAGPLRIPGVRPGTAGTPPPASTFYPVTRVGRPGAEPMVRPSAAAPALAPGYSKPARVGVMPAAPIAAPPARQAAPPVAGTPARTDNVTRSRSQPTPPPAAGAPAMLPSSPPPAQSAPAYAAPAARPAQAKPPGVERAAPMPAQPSRAPQAAPVPGVGAPVAAPAQVQRGGSQAGPGPMPNQGNARAEKPAHAEKPAASKVEAGPAPKQP